MRDLAILGSTGSVGVQTLNVLDRNPGKYKVRLLVARANWRLLEEQARRYTPETVVLTQEDAAKELHYRLRDMPIKVLAGEQALAEQLESVRYSMVVAAMVGHAGLLPVLSAIRAGSDIALANKEVLVMAGHLVTKLCREKGVNLIPLDSEHSAIFQCLRGHPRGEVRSIILTASGGPFRGMSAAELEHVTPDQAVRHPNWRMGAKISVDSATLMNKGLEVIEAHWLFGIEPEKIRVVIHPQSIVHSMVEFIDGSVLAQLGVVSMELPIQYALSWPRRWPGAREHYIDWLQLPPLHFEEPDRLAFPCLDLARAALTEGGNAPAVLSAANDLCVEAFLQGAMGFNAIPRVIAEIRKRVPWRPNPGVEEIFETVAQVKAEFRDILKDSE